MSNPIPMFKQYLHVINSNQEDDKALNELRNMIKNSEWGICYDLDTEKYSVVLEVEE